MFADMTTATPTAHKFDNIDLYQNIGDLVIQLACEGNRECLRVYKTAWDRTVWDAEDGQ